MLACVLFVAFWCNFSCLLVLNQSKIKACCDINHVLYLTDVTVKNVLLQSVKQTKADTLEATIAGDTKSVKATDIKIVNAETNVVYPVHTVSVDAKDATKVTLTVFSPLTDGKNYDVTLDGVTKSFKATDGAVAAISVDPITIPYATEKEIKLIATDAQGVVLKELAYGTPDTNYDFTINANGNGYTNGSKLYLNKVGDTATAEITYKSGKYDQDGKPVGNIGPNKVTITATAQSEVSNFDVRIDATTATKYEKAKDNKQIPVNESTKNIAYFMIKDADGTEIGNYRKYTIETSDKTVLMIDDSDISDKEATLTALKTGTAYILIKDTNGNVVNSVAINVVAERAVATLELNTYSVAVSKDLAGDNKVVKATVKDQYGDDFSLSENLNVECLSAPTGVTLSSTSAFYSIANYKDITFNNSPTVKGTYVYKISYKKDGKEVVAKTVSVDVKKAASTTATSWRLNVVNDGVDIKVDDNNKTSQNIKVALIGMNDGIDVVKESSVGFIVKDPNGVVKFDSITSPTAVTNASISVVSDELTVNALTVTATTATQNFAAGTYTVTALKTVAGKKVEITTNFTIKNTQAKPSVDVKENTVNGATVSAALDNALVVTYGEDVYTNRSDKATGDKALVITTVEGKRNDGVTINAGTSVSSGNYFTVTKLVVTVEVASGITMDIEVSVPGTITIK